MIPDRLKNIIYHQDFNWQYPATTEKQAFLNHLSREAEISPDFGRNIYVGVPWANHIDDPDVIAGNLGKLRRSFSTLKSAIDKKKLEALRNNTQLVFHTVCQHVRWYRLTEFWNYLGIDLIWLSHMTTDLDQDRFRPWPLYAVNIENPGRGIGLRYLPTDAKQFLCSFIGAHTNKYRSDIRVSLQQVFRGEKSERVFFELFDDWFFQSLVYEGQVKNKKIELESSHFEKIQTYNHTLSNSIFSLCPEGSGPNSIRLWESMAMGVIPVLFENDLVFPQLDTIDWSEFTVMIKKSDLPDTINILRSITKEKVESMSLKCLEAYRQFRLKTCF